MAKKNFKLKQFLKNRDLFGHQISLNFNQQGDKHRTVVGGLVSILIKFLYYLYMAYLLHKMVHNEDDRTFSFEIQIDEEE